jgi:hypothetical protein
MDNKTEKVLGYALLAAGLVIIVLSAYNAYLIFTGASAPPQVFKMESVVINLNSNSGPANSLELISGQNASKFTNMAVWYVLMFFLAQAGGKISSLGIQLLKEIKVVVKAKDGLTAISGEQF